MRTIGVRFALTAALAWACAAASACGSSDAVDGTVAAVLDAKGLVALVDLDRGEVVDTVKLRSWAGDIASDAETGVFVTAQSGGVGQDADDALAIIDVRADRGVRYVTLPRPNPLGVETVRGGIALVDHGWMEREGMFACLVDTRAGRVVERGHIPDNNGPITIAGGAGWSPGVDVVTDRPSLRRIELRTLASTEAPEIEGHAFVECETPHGLAGWVRDGDGGALLARFDARSGSLEATAAVEFVDGPGRLVACGGLLVAVDFTGDRLASPGKRLLVFDACSMRQVREIGLSGAPSDIAVWDERVVVVNYGDQTLQVVDPATGRVESTVSLPNLADLPLRIAVLDS